MEAVINTMKLSDLKSGDHGIVKSFDGDTHFRKKMVEMGLIKGKEIEVVNGRSGSPFVLQVGGSQIMVGWGMVEKIGIDKI